MSRRPNKSSLAKAAERKIQSMSGVNKSAAASSPGLIGKSCVLGLRWAYLQDVNHPELACDMHSSPFLFRIGHFQSAGPLAVVPEFIPNV